MNFIGVFLWFYKIPSEDSLAGRETSTQSFWCTRRCWSKSEVSSFYRGKLCRTRSSYQPTRCPRQLSCVSLRILAFQFEIARCDCTRTCRPNRELLVVAVEDFFAALFHYLQCVEGSVECSISYRVDLNGFWRIDEIIYGQLFSWKLYIRISIFAHFPQLFSLFTDIICCDF